MSGSGTGTGSRGFSLVELLVVMAIMGMVMASVYGLYLNTQRTANTSEEVVEVQQNLRIALEMITRDLRMSGFALRDTAGSGALAVARGDTLTIRLASPFHRYARIVEDVVVDNDLTEVVTFKITADQAGFLREGMIFHVYRPQNGRRVFTAAMEATDDPALVGGTWQIDLKLLASLGAVASAEVLQGDMLARIPAAGYNPDSGIVYRLADDPDSADPAMRVLERVVSGAGGSAVIAAKLHDDGDGVDDGLTLRYILRNGSVESPAAGVDLAADLDEVVGVEVTLTGATDATQTGQQNYSGVKTRQVSGSAQIKNRFAKS